MPCMALNSLSMLMCR